MADHKRDGAGGEEPDTKRPRSSPPTTELAADDDDDDADLARALALSLEGSDEGAAAAAAPSSSGPSEEGSDEGGPGSSESGVSTEGHLNRMPSEAAAAAGGEGAAMLDAECRAALALASALNPAGGDEGARVFELCVEYLVVKQQDWRQPDRRTSGASLWAAMKKGSWRSTDRVQGGPPAIARARAGGSAGDRGEKKWDWGASSTRERGTVAKDRVEVAFREMKAAKVVLPVWELAEAEALCDGKLSKYAAAVLVAVRDALGPPAPAAAVVEFTEDAVGVRYAAGKEEAAAGDDPFTDLGSWSRPMLKHVLPTDQNTRSVSSVVLCGAAGMPHSEPELAAILGVPVGKFSI